MCTLPKVQSSQHRLLCWKGCLWIIGSLRKKGCHDGCMVACIADSGHFVWWSVLQVSCMVWTWSFLISWFFPRVYVHVADWICLSHRMLSLWRILFLSEIIDVIRCYPRVIPNLSHVILHIFPNARSLSSQTFPFMGMFDWEEGLIPLAQSRRFTQRSGLPNLTLYIPVCLLLIIILWP